MCSSDLGSNATTSDDEAIAEDEAPWRDPHVTMMPVPTGLVPVMRDLIEKERNR